MMGDIADDMRIVRHGVTLGRRFGREMLRIGVGPSARLTCAAGRAAWETWLFGDVARAGCGDRENRQRFLTAFVAGVAIEEERRRSV